MYTAKSGKGVRGQGYVWTPYHVGEVDAVAAPGVGAEGVDAAEEGLFQGGVRDAGKHASLDQAQARGEAEGLGVGG